LIHQLLLAVLLWQGPSFIEQSIASASDLISKEPNKPEGYNDLALAMVRKERETGDPSFLTLAESAIQKSLKLEAANFGGRRAKVALRLRQHRYEDALEEAEALRKERPDDNPIYGFISEAQVAIGNYPEAEKAVQRMLDLRSVNGPGFEYGAIVREMIGFPAPAIDWWTSALHLVSDRDREEKAYIYSQMARVQRETGKYDLGVQSAGVALDLEPHYPAAAFELARIRIEQKQPQAAVDLLLPLAVRPNHVESVYWLAVAQQSAGDTAASASSFSRFEKQAFAASTSPVNCNALLVRYLAEHGRAAEAVKLAQQSLDRRHDVFLRQAYAVALSRNNQPAEAMDQIKLALEPGLQDATLYFDAGMIAKQKNDPESASAYFRKAFELNASGPHSAEILRQLGTLATSGAF
jgi:tetratricopeptide (TPR) repeat protein